MCFGAGSQARSSTYVDDRGEGIDRLSQSDEVEPVNIGTPEEISILDVAREIISVTGSSSEIIFKSLPEDDPKVRQPDISRARKVLNWEPLTSRREGLLKTKAYFEEKIRSEERRVGKEGRSWRTPQ